MDWIAFVTGLPAFENDAVFAEAVLQAVALQKGNISTRDGQKIVEILAGKRCVPTNKGSMQKPSDTYLQTVNLFPDLPLVQLSSKAINGPFLSWLGVRGHVDLQLVFDRLHDLEWDHVQLMKYFSCVQLSEVELTRLRNTPLVPKEERQRGKSPDDETTGAVSEKTIDKEAKKFVASAHRFCVGDLYAPTEEFRKLELPVIFWPLKWKEGNEDGKVQLIANISLNRNHAPQSGPTY